MKYTWVSDWYRQAMNNFWIPEEINLNQDVKDYRRLRDVYKRQVESFLENNPDGLKGVVAGGSRERHAATFGWAGDIISEKYNVPCLYKVDGEGSEEDVEKIKQMIR